MGPGPRRWWAAGEGLLRRTAKEDRCRLLDRFQSLARGGVVDVLRKSQGKPDIAIAERHDAPRASSSSSTSATRSGVISSSGTAS
jgi:hypothetical protein